MKHIALTLGKYALVDDDSHEDLHKWSYDNTSGYAVRHTSKNGQTKRIYLHRAVAGAKGKQEVDHRNGDRLDCRKDNLRFCTRSENRMNSAKMLIRNGKRTSSHYKGVTWRPRTGRWEAYIVKKKRQMSLGEFENECEAAIHYDVAAQLFFGEFARLNFPI